MLGKSRAGLRTLAGLAAASMLLATGCSSAATPSASGSAAASSSAPAAANLTMTFLPKNLGNAYFDTSFKGVQTAVAALGGTVTQVGPAKGDDPAGQVSYINTATQQQVGALAGLGQRQGGDLRRAEGSHDRRREGRHLRLRHHR